MSRAEKSARKHPALETGIPWMFWGLLIGWMAGAIDEFLEGISMFRMMAGGIAGLLLGALLDAVRNQRQKRPAANSPQNRRGKPR